jgi:replicative DNA helicase
MEAGRAPTGIHGLDAATSGGLPAGRTSLVQGGPGAGKTVPALRRARTGADVLPRRHRRQADSPTPAPAARGGKAARKGGRQ